MATREEYGCQPIEARLNRMDRTAGEIGAAISGLSDALLSQRPAPGSWSAKEVICHLRDIEELFLLRFRTMLALDEPTFLVLGEMPPDQAAALDAIDADVIASGRPKLNLVEAYTGAGGPAAAARLHYPEGIAFNAGGDLFIADSGDYVIYKVDAASGVITAAAGIEGSGASSGDGGPAS